MLHKKIEQLIPYVSANFITYPLWEEGIYLPSINFWKIFDNKLNREYSIKPLLDKLNASGYSFYHNVGENHDNIFNYSIQPEFTYTDDGGYELVNKDWSIEEMVDILVEFLNEKK